MIRYRRRKLLRKIQQNSNAIVYSAIFLMASVITITAATGRIKKAEYIESTTSYAVENSVYIEDSKVNKLLNTEYATEEVIETTTKHIGEIDTSKYDDKFVMNTSGVLNIRKEASIHSEIIGQLEENASGTIIENGESWTKIKSGKVEGYVSTKYILVGDEAKSKIENSTTEVAVVKADILNVREKKSTDSSVIGMATGGDKYKVVSKHDKWIEIKIEEKTGYVSKEFIKIEVEAKTAKTIEQINAEITAKAQAELKANEETKAEVETEVQVEKASTTPETTKSAIVNDKATNTNADDTYLLACLVMSEAGGESYEGKLAVANVVLNRVKAGWAGSIKDVIYAPGQFGPATNGSLARALKSGPDSGSKNAAKAALAGTNNVPGFYSFGTTTSINTKKLKTYKVIGAHVFY